MSGIKARMVSEGTRKETRQLNTIEVRIVKLEPSRVASARAFGPSPESIAWQKLLTWARANGMPTEQGKTRFFGFNNPNPSAGSPNYGYEQWMTVANNVTGSGEVQVKQFPGGLYCVTRCTLANISEAWQALVAWAEQSKYKEGNGVCLEECLSTVPAEFPVAVFDLYLPINE